MEYERFMAAAAAADRDGAAQAGRAWTRPPAT
jgi:hypothetical protein